MKIEKKAQKSLLKMPARTRSAFFNAFDRIDSGDTDGLDIKPLQGTEGLKRLRIGKYRAIYTINLELIVIAAGSRGDAYKGL